MENGAPWHAVPGKSILRLAPLLLLVPTGVDRREAGPLFRQILQRKNRRHRTHWHARAAVDAFRRIDVQLLLGLEPGLVLARMNAVHRADVHARSVLGADARLGDYVSHSTSPLSRPRAGRFLRGITCAVENFLISRRCFSQQASSNELYAARMGFSTSRRADNIQVRITHEHSDRTRLTPAFRGYRGLCRTASRFTTNAGATRKIRRQAGTGPGDDRHPRPAKVDRAISG